MTMFEAFETPIGARDMDRSWRGMVARARREYLSRLMPIWAAVLTLATLVLGVPGLYLLGAATGFSDNPSILVVLDHGPLASALAVVSRWVQPLVSVLSPTDQRFGIEAFAIGTVLMLGLAALVRAAGSRQWYQSVYDDIPSRRWLLLALLWGSLPLIVGFLMMFFGALIVEVRESPAIVGALVALIAVVVLCAALCVVYLTFSVREPAIPSVILGALCAAVGLCLVTIAIEWIPGVRSLPAGETSPFRALVSLSVLLFVAWSIVLAGSQLAVAISRRHDPIERFNRANRGEQLDFALGLVRDLEAQTRAKRWAQIEDLARAQAAPLAMVTYALDRLRRSGIVDYSDDGSRPPRRWAIKNDLETLSLHDLSRAMGTNLDPLPGLHGRSNEDIIGELAEREHLSQTQNLLSLFRDEDDLSRPIGEPLLAVTDVDYRLGEQDAFASSRVFEPIAQVVDRTSGDNGGPAKGEESYVFVETVVDEGMVLDVQSGPSAVLDPDEYKDPADGVALDLTSAMRIVPVAADNQDRDLPAAPAPVDPDESGSVLVSSVAEGEFDGEALAVSEPAPLKLGDASPLAAVREEIDHLLSGEPPMAVEMVAPLAVWRRSAAAAQAAAVARAADRARPKPAFVPAGMAEAVPPQGTWKAGTVPARDPQLDPMLDPAPEPDALGEAKETADAVDDVPDSSHSTHPEWLLPVPPQRSWQRESGAASPAQSWKRGAG